MHDALRQKHNFKSTKGTSYADSGQTKKLGPNKRTKKMSYYVQFSMKQNLDPKNDQLNNRPNEWEPIWMERWNNARHNAAHKRDRKWVVALESLRMEPLNWGHHFDEFAFKKRRRTHTPAQIECGKFYVVFGLFLRAIFKFNQQRKSNIFNSIHYTIQDTAEEIP